MKKFTLTFICTIILYYGSPYAQSITGYEEDFSASEIYGADYYNSQGPLVQDWTADINKYPGKWYVEGQGTVQTLSVDK